MDKIPVKTRRLGFIPIKSGLTIFRWSWFTKDEGIFARSFMPNQFFNFSRYFKKNIQGSASAAADSYSGIGNPAAAGQAYSGIGNPPSINPVQTVQSQTGMDLGKGITDDSSKRTGMDVLSRLTARANQALMLSVSKVKELKLSYIDTEYVLWGLLHDSGIYQLISECKVTPGQIQTEVEKSFQTGDFTGQPQFSPRVKRVMEISLTSARSLGYEFISPEHILLALSFEGEGMAARILGKYSLTKEILQMKIIGRKEESLADKKNTGALDQYTEDLTAKAAAGTLDPVVGRSWEIERIIHILSRRTKNNPVLIGDAGVGKTAIVEGLALRIAQKDVPETLLHKRILLLDLMSLIAGAKHRGEFEERLKNLIKEVKIASGAIILFIDELHNMVGAGSSGEGTMDAGNILKPSLARGELQMIGTTTVTEYRNHIEKDPALERRFQPVLVAEPTAEVAIEMLTALRDRYEAFHRVKISDEAIEAAVKLSGRYISDRFLPDKAVDLIDEAAASVRLPAISLPEEIKTNEARIIKLTGEKKEAEKINDRVHTENLAREIEELQKNLGQLKEQYQVKKSTTTNVVTPEVIAEIVSRWTKIPVARLTESESTKLLELEKIIHKRLIDQDEAVAAVSEAVRRGRAGLKSNQRPIGSFIFMGPTGVGKTELAKILAETLFGSQDLIVRLDMTEYMEKHEVAKLIGAPPGYVGYEEGGQLTEAVRRRPYAVVLLDEIEKAHPDVFNILIQLLDDGRLTDNKGHTISFKNTIVICTSNLGSGIIQEELLKESSKFKVQSSKLTEEKPEEEKQVTDSSQLTTDNKGQNVMNEEEKFIHMAERLMEEMRKFFRPELLNRFDEIVIFRPLTREHMKQIVDLQLNYLSKLLEEQNISIKVSSETKVYLAEIGFDPVYGARPLRRTIQRMVENQISSLLIKGELAALDTIMVDIDPANKELTFSVQKSGASKKEVANQNIPTASSTTSETSQEAVPSSGQIPNKAVNQQNQPQTPDVNPTISANPLGEYFTPTDNTNTPPAPKPTGTTIGDDKPDSSTATV